MQTRDEYTVFSNGFTIIRIPCGFPAKVGGVVNQGSTCRTLCWFTAVRIERVCTGASVIGMGFGMMYCSKAIFGHTRPILGGGAIPD